VLSTAAEAAGIPWPRCGRACRTTSPATRRRRRRRSRCSTASPSSRARSSRAGSCPPVPRVGGIDRRRGIGRRGDDRVHPPAGADARHVGLARGVRRRHRAGVRACAAAAARVPANPVAPTPAAPDQYACSTPKLSRMISTMPSTTR
jgi:hypothetical protein